MSTTKLSTVASNLDICELGDERVIDFDIAANTEYEIQSCVIVDEDDRVIEAVVRFGRVEERPELGIDKSILYPAWANMVSDATTSKPSRATSATLAISSRTSASAARTSKSTA